MGVVKVALEKPLQLTSTAGAPVGPLVAELHLRDEICTGDLRGIRARFLSDPTFDEITKVVSRLCGQPEELLNKMSMPDFDQVGSMVLGFFKRGPATGTTPSPGSPTDSPPSTPGP